jgi:hypothetical protein
MIRNLLAWGEDYHNREEFYFGIGKEEEEIEYIEEDEEYDCPMHGKLGGYDECPKCGG